MIERAKGWRPVPPRMPPHAILFEDGDYCVAMIEFNPIPGRVAFSIVGLAFLGFFVAGFLGNERLSFELIPIGCGVIGLGLLIWAFIMPAPSARVGRRGTQGWVSWGVAPFLRHETFDATRIRGVGIRRPSPTPGSVDEWPMVSIQLSRGSVELGAKLNEAQLQWMAYVARESVFRVKDIEATG